MHVFMTARCACVYEPVARGGVGADFGSERGGRRAWPGCGSSVRVEGRKGSGRGDRQEE